MASPRMRAASSNRSSDSDGLKGNTAAGCTGDAEAASTDDEDDDEHVGSSSCNEVDEAAGSAGVEDDGDDSVGGAAVRASDCVCGTGDGAADVVDVAATVTVVDVLLLITSLHDVESLMGASWLRSSGDR